jgi:hypothetical protein
MLARLSNHRISKVGMLILRRICRAGGGKNAAACVERETAS